jgi:hypothetical protein
MANTLSKSLTRVRDEILAWRGERERLLSGLQLTTLDRRRAVLRMLARFAMDLAEIAQRRRSVRMVFLPGLSPRRMAFRQDFPGLGSAAANGAARIRQNRQAATQAHCEEHVRPKREAVEPCRESAPATTRTERGRRRQGVHHQHRP